MLSRSSEIPFLELAKAKARTALVEKAQSAAYSSSTRTLSGVNYPPWLQFGPRLVLPPIIVENGPPEGPPPGSQNRLKDGLKSAAMIESRHSPAASAAARSALARVLRNAVEFLGVSPKSAKESAVCSRPPSGQRVVSAEGCAKTTRQCVLF